MAEDRSTAWVERGVWTRVLKECTKKRRETLYIPARVGHLCSKVDVRSIDVSLDACFNAYFAEVVVSTSVNADKLRFGDVILKNPKMLLSYRGKAEIFLI